ncbi:mechanosensitive ion channel [uncultured Hyphomonas sp.]|jgi:small-conductance mechanosensitive channel|uniref:mechanosensitive ion channel family protein n=1 Tax=uncultured Hyphomonas sp. TaxID=225298 RepID=UPI001A5A11DF|nr:mechanosensitive ion channel [Hyphomonas sp.]|tara:strand:- start:97736 stop:98641 length:906 start_codon:yes stop_codon:yes gene_type:complete
MEFTPIEDLKAEVESMASAFFKSLPNLTIALVILVVTLLAGRIIRAVVSAAMQRAHVRDALVTLARNLISIAAWVLGVAIAMTVIFPSVSPSDIIAGLGLTSVAIGFAFKDVFENFLAGVIILGREKLRIGDVIECEDVYGRVENILIRETHVREIDGELVIVPNSYLFKNPVNIETDRGLKRQELVVGVDYDTDMRQAKAVLQDALESCETVKQSETKDVQCVSFGGSSIDFKLLWWSGSRPAEQRETYDEVAFAVKDALDEAGITIPFPQSTLSFREEAMPIPLKSILSEKQEAANENG